MTTYYLNRGYNIEKFKEICKAIEVLYPSYKKDKLLVDVDNSFIERSLLYRFIIQTLQHISINYTTVYLLRIYLML